MAILKSTKAAKPAAARAKIREDYIDSLIEYIEARTKKAQLKAQEKAKRCKEEQLNAYAYLISLR